MNLSILINEIGVPEFRAVRYLRGVDTLTPVEARKVREAQTQSEPEPVEYKYTRKCTRCQAEFKTDNAWRKLCHEGCRDSSTAIWQPVKKKAIQCKVCAVKFYPKRQGNWSYCSQSCAKVAETARDKGNAPGSFKNIILKFRGAV